MHHGRGGAELGGARWAPQPHARQADAVAGRHRRCALGGWELSCESVTGAEIVASPRVTWGGRAICGVTRLTVAASPSCPRAGGPLPGQTSLLARDASPCAYRSPSTARGACGFQRDLVSWLRTGVFRMVVGDRPTHIPAWRGVHTAPGMQLGAVSLQERNTSSYLTHLYWSVSSQNHSPF